LATLSKRNVLKDFYLAGGTGAALQLGHRVSFDFDFFTNKDFNAQNFANKFIALDLKIDRIEEETLIGTVSGLRFSFFTYLYPLLFPLRAFNSIWVADLQDIALMKIAAIASRGSKKDFVDLYFVCTEITPLDQLLQLFEKKYKSVRYEKLHLLKSLVYFADAEGEVMPDMLKPCAWKEVKNYFEQEIKRLTMW